jgi:hypothetical protein
MEQHLMAQQVRPIKVMQAVIQLIVDLMAQAVAAVLVLLVLMQEALAVMVVME